MTSAARLVAVRERPRAQEAPGEARDSSTGLGTLPLLRRDQAERLSWFNRERRIIRRRLEAQAAQRAHVARYGPGPP